MLKTDERREGKIFRRFSVSRARTDFDSCKVGPFQFTNCLTMIDYRINQQVNRIYFCRCNWLIISLLWRFRVHVWGACGRWFESSHPDWWKILDIQSNIEDFSFVVYSPKNGGGTQVVHKWSLFEKFQSQSLSIWLLVSCCAWAYIVAPNRRIMNFIRFVAIWAVIASQ